MTRQEIDLLTKENYKFPASEASSYHVVQELKQFDPATGERLSYPQIQKYGLKEFRELYSELKQMGYDIRILHDPLEAARLKVTPKVEPQPEPKVEEKPLTEEEQLVADEDEDVDEPTDEEANEVEEPTEAAEGEDAEEPEYRTTRTGRVRKVRKTKKTKRTKKA